MLETLTQLRQGHDGNKLPRCHTNQLRYQHWPDAVTQNIVQQMDCGCRSIPSTGAENGATHADATTIEAMPTTVNPIIQRIKNRQVQQQTDPRNISNAEPGAVELEKSDAADAERAKAVSTVDPA